MRTALFAAMLFLPVACASAPREIAVPDYPVTVNYREDQCWFSIQDMWMPNVTMVEGWLAALPDKSGRVDVVWQTDQDRRCIDTARRAVERAGFTSIHVRRGSAEDYPDLLRCTARESVVR